MSDQITMVERTLREVHKVGSSEDRIAVKLSIVSAIDFYRTHMFWFNQATDTNVTIVSDQQSYSTDDGFPADFIMPYDLYILVGGVRWLKLYQRDIDTVRWLTPTSTVVGVPTNWCWWDDKLWLTPIPDDGTSSTLRLDYIQDIGTPSYTYTGGVFEFYDEDGAEWADTWTNAWITEAEELIRARAKWDYYWNFKDDMENAQKMAVLVDVAYGALVKKSTNYDAYTERVATPI